MMIEIAGKWVNPAHVVSAEVVTTNYMNGSSSKLVIKLDDGSQVVHEHGYEFDAWAMLNKIVGTAVEAAKEIERLRTALDDANDPTQILPHLR